MALIAGNWKMNGLRADIVELDAMIAAGPVSGAVLLICPPVTLLAQFAMRAAGSSILIGAQDCAVGTFGAHTGDISATMLADAGASHVIVGHSERRTDHREADALVRQKAASVLDSGLVAILCVGETQSERARGETLAVLERQLSESLPPAAAPASLIIAYEPVWAIGTGVTPTLEQVAEVHAAIKAHAGPNYSVLYGGSVKPDNAAALLALGDVGGALVGGASLKASDFLAIAQAVPDQRA